jgi:hypothetical protein
LGQGRVLRLAIISEVSRRVGQLCPDLGENFVSEQIVRRREGPNLRHQVAYGRRRSNVGGRIVVSVSHACIRGWR